MKDYHFISRFLFGIWLVLISSINLFSQNNNENKNEWWLGANLNIFISCMNSDFETVEFGKNINYRFQVENTNPVNLGIGIKKVNGKNWFQEFALSSLNVKKDRESIILEIQDQGISTTTSGRERTSIDILLRWEYGKLFLLKGIKNLSPGISLSLDPFFHFNRIEFSTSQGFPFSSYRLGAEIALIPRIEYEISRNVSLIVKIPIGFNKIYFEQSKTEHPNLTNNENKNSNLVNEFGVNHFQSSIGISYKI